MRIGGRKSAVPKNTTLWSSVCRMASSSIRPRVLVVLCDMEDAA